MTGPIELDEAALKALPLPRHREGDDKEDRGLVLIIGGSAENPGAALLAGQAAMRVGAGKLRIATCASVAAPLAIAMPEARIYAMAETPAGGVSAAESERLLQLAHRAAAVVVGPGMLDHQAIAAVV